VILADEGICFPVTDPIACFDDSGTILNGKAVGHAEPVVSFMVCFTGLFVSVMQIGMASGAKFWQEYWEHMLSAYEAEVRLNPPESKSPKLFHDDSYLYEKTVRARIHSHGFGGLASKLILCRFSVSRIPIYVGIVLSIIWGLLFLCTLRAYPPLAIPSFVVGF
jgi:hypothetical protein